MEKLAKSLQKEDANQENFEILSLTLLVYSFFLKDLTEFEALSKLILIKTKSWVLNNLLGGKKKLRELLAHHSLL